MRSKILTSLVVLLASCAVSSSAPEDHSVTTYYDRNKDGVVDYELHRVPGTTYWTWALIDSKFTGRYDRRLKLASICESRHFKFSQCHLTGFLFQ